jgi:hypothetical protein
MIVPGVDGAPEILNVFKGPVPHALITPTLTIPVVKVGNVILAIVSPGAVCVVTIAPVTFVLQL